MTLNEINPEILFEALKVSDRRLKKYNPTKKHLNDVASFMTYITIPAFILGIIRSRKRNKIDLVKFMRMPINKRLEKYNGQQLTALIIWSHMKPLEWKIKKASSDEEVIELTLKTLNEIDIELRSHREKAAKNQYEDLDKGIKDIQKVIDKLRKKQNETK